MSNSFSEFTRIIVKPKIAYNTNRVMTMALLHLEKAHDSIWKDGLILKLYSLNFLTPSIKILKLYFNKSLIKVNIIDKYPNIKTPLGVFRKGFLSSVLFNIFIDKTPVWNNTELALFSDDTAIFSSSTEESFPRRNILRHLNLLSTFFEQWRFQTNASNTKFIIFRQWLNRERNLITHPSMLNKSCFFLRERNLTIQPSMLNKSCFFAFKQTLFGCSTLLFNRLRRKKLNTLCRQTISSHIKVDSHLVNL